MPRSDDINALIVRALTSPQNLLPAAAVAGVGLAFGFWPLYLAAIVVYAGGAIATIKSPSEARKVLTARRGRSGLTLESSPELELADPTVRRLYAEAREESQSLADTLDDSGLELGEVSTELAGMAGDLVTLCRHADRISAYLGSVDQRELSERRDEARAQLDRAGSPERDAALERSVAALSDQLTLIEQLTELRDRFHAEIQALVSSLGAIRGEVVRIGVSADDADGAEGRLRRQVGSAREDMRRLSAAMREKVGSDQGALPA